MRPPLLCLAFVALGCAHSAGSSPGTGGARASQYYPLAVGHKWTYERAVLGETGTFEISIDKRDGAAFVDSTGARLSLDAFGVRDDRRYLLKEPIEEGKGWNNTISASTFERYVITSTKATVTVPAGTFDDCVVVESKNRIKDNAVLVNQMTFAKGVGMVMIRTHLETDGRKLPQAVLRLQKHVPAPTTP